MLEYYNNSKYSKAFNIFVTLNINEFIDYSLGIINKYIIDS